MNFDIPHPRLYLFILLAPFLFLSSDVSAQYQLLLEQTNTRLEITIRSPKEDGGGQQRRDFRAGLHFLAGSTSFPGPQGESTTEGDRHVYRVTLDRGTAASQFTVYALVHELASNQWFALGPEHYSQIGGEQSNNPDITVQGVRQRFHPLTLDYEANEASTESISTFRNNRLNITFRHESGQQVVVPGYFAADGDAANSSATSGRIWRTHFVPHLTGFWTFSSDHRVGSDVAISLSPNAGRQVGHSSGSFYIGETQAEQGFKAKGPLIRRGRYFRHLGTNELWIKNGMDSPETFLGAYIKDLQGNIIQQIDNTPAPAGRTPDFTAHIPDFDQGEDPSWQEGKGMGLIGALNWLARNSANSFYFLTYNTDGGDGRQVFPWVNTENKSVFDVSKLEQWRIILEHAGFNLDMAAHLISAERENDHVMNESERKHLIREFMARFGHLPALLFNLGEERQDFDSSNQYTNGRINSELNFLHDLYPYGSPLVGVHNWPGAWHHFSAPRLQYLSLQAGHLDGAAQEIETLRSIYPDKLITLDEVGPASVGISPDASRSDFDLRRKKLFASLLGGLAGGWEFYFGYRNNPDCGDMECLGFQTLRYSYQRLFQHAGEVKDFFIQNVPLGRLHPAHQLLVNRGNYDFAAASSEGDLVVAYFDRSGSSGLRLPSSGTFTVKWYDPARNEVFSGNDITGTEGQIVSMNFPGSGDYAVILEK